MRKINTTTNWRRCQSHSPMAAAVPRVRSLAATGHLGNRTTPSFGQQGSPCPAPCTVLWLPDADDSRYESDLKFMLFSRISSFKLATSEISLTFVSVLIFLTGLLPFLHSFCSFGLFLFLNYILCVHNWKPASSHQEKKYPYNNWHLQSHPHDFQ